MTTVNVIDALDVNEAWEAALHLMRSDGILRPSRNGAVYEVPGPVVTVYQNPCSRVLVDPYRDANPFFHLMEALWMLAGRNDLATMEQFVPRMRDYSDDGKTLWGAYGYRWREFYRRDQLDEIVERLRRDYSDRRCVLTMWGLSDLARDGRDVPCNTHVYFKVRPAGLLEGSMLDMTVCNRSNDIIWGLYGANAVHMSLMHEVMAARVGVPVGRMTTLSDSFHAYEDTLAQYWNRREDYTRNNYVPSLSTVAAGSMPDEEIDLFVDFITPKVKDEKRKLVIFNSDIRHPFLTTVALPMYEAWRYWQEHRDAGVWKHLDKIEAADWRVACAQWFERRLSNDGG